MQYANSFARRGTLRGAVIDKMDLVFSLAEAQIRNGDFESRLHLAYGTQADDLLNALTDYLRATVRLRLTKPQTPDLISMHGAAKRRVNDITSGLLCDNTQLKCIDGIVADMIKRVDEPKAAKQQAAAQEPEARSEEAPARQGWNLRLFRRSQSSIGARQVAA